MQTTGEEGGLDMSFPHTKVQTVFISVIKAQQSLQPCQQLFNVRHKGQFIINPHAQILITLIDGDIGHLNQEFFFQPTARRTFLISELGIGCMVNSSVDVTEEGIDKTFE